MFFVENKRYDFIWTDTIILNTIFIHRPCDHEPLHRTQSEEPPRSPFEVNQFSKSSQFYEFDQQSYGSSRQSEIETSKSEILSTENVLTHSRNLSQDSANSFRTIDVSMSKVSQSSGSVHFSQDHLTLSRPGSGATLADISYDRCYETNSLPRQKCDHHKHEFHTYSLPRKEPHLYHNHPLQHHDSCTRTDSTETFNGTLPRQISTTSISRNSSTDSIHPNSVVTSPASYAAAELANGRRSYENIIAYKRPSYPNIQPPNGQQTLMRRRSSYQPNGRNTPSEELCSTCESESDSKQEQEIFIDFKPRISPQPSPRSRKKRLQKTLSEGEILFDQRRTDIGETGTTIQMASASEEDLKTPDDSESTASAKLMYSYRNAPIKDEGICDKNHLLKLPRDEEMVLRNRREAFRKRSISLEDPSMDEDKVMVQVHTPSKSASPPSPCLDELSVRAHSDFPSTDSLANDLTKDHSDGIWNESQATVLQADPRYGAQIFYHITMYIRRKNQS